MTRAQAEARNEQLFRRIFFLVLVVVVGAVIVGFGPVWLSAEATRAAQQSEQLKAEIADALSIAETLEMKHSTLMSSTRVGKVARTELGMVPEDTDRTYIELGSSSMTNVVALSAGDVGIGGNEDGNTTQAVAAALAPAATRGFNLKAMAVDSLNTLARLTAGEASTLLVGDVGLASFR